MPTLKSYFAAKFVHVRIYLYLSCPLGIRTLFGYNLMEKILSIIIAVATVCIASCSRSESHYSEIIGEADRLMHTDTDSAMQMLDDIEPSELAVDSIRAQYHYLKAYGHLLQNRSMIGDSLIAFAHNYYRGKDVVRDIRSGTALAWYKFWVGDMPGAINMLDSLVTLNNVSDSLLTQPLRIRVLLGAAEYQGCELIPFAKSLTKLETDTIGKMEAKYMLACAYTYASELDSALMITDELIKYSRANNWGDKQFIFELERAQILTEAGRYSESDAAIDSIFRKAGPDNGAADYLHFQYTMNALNTGDINRASRELTLADSLARRLRSDDDTYYSSYSNLFHALIDFRQTGHIMLVHINSLNNRQRERFNRIQASQWESEQGALQQQGRALALKAESEHKTVVILIITLVSILLLTGASLIIRHRRQRERENEERAEALQKMVDELKSTPSTQQSEVHAPAALRRAMLQQLGIIKMVAETPTEQNREMLRKISSIGGETDGELVNWESVFELINNLYSGFYDKLHDRYGEQLTNKEEQIIVLMIAGFSTKEISVITSQTTSTIYVRKSSIRKKLGAQEKEDIAAFLREAFVH